MRQITVPLMVLVAATAASGQWLETHIHVGYDAWGVAYSLAQEKVYVGPEYPAGSSMVVIDANTLIPLRTVRNVPFDIWRWCYNEQDDKLYIRGWANSPVTVIDCTADSVVARNLVGHSGIDAEMCYNPLVNRAYCAHHATVVGICGSGDTAASYLPAGPGVRSLALCTRLNKLYVASGSFEESRVIVFDCTTDSAVAVIEGVRSVDRLCYGPEVDRVYAHGQDGVNRVYVIDCATDSVIAVVEAGGAHCFGMCYNPHQDKLYIASYTDNFVDIMDCATNTVLNRVQPGSMPMVPLFNPVNDKVYIGTADSVVAVIDGVSDTIVGRLWTGGFGPMCWHWAQNRVFVPAGGLNSVAVLRDSMETGMKAEKPMVGFVQPGATIACGSLFLPGSNDPSASWVLFSISGRRVMDLQPGENDIRHVAPGVYFVRPAVGGERSAVAKVVIQR